MKPRENNLNVAIVLLEILRRMPKVGAISTKTIHNHLLDAGFNVSDRTVQRYMELLSEHFDIKRDVRSKPYGYCWENYACGLEIPLLSEQESLILMLAKARWCPKKYAASNAPVIDIEKTDGKCLNVIEHLLGKTAGFTHRTAYPLAQTAVISLNADGI